jgi:hypothetical protein
MAAVGSVWARPPAPLRVLGELVAVAAELPRFGLDVSLGVGARLGSALVGRRILRRSYLGPLIERSGVLSGATVVLHGVSPAPRMGEEPPARCDARHFHVLDVTVEPHQEWSGARRWTPGDLALVAPGALPACPEEDEEVGLIFHAERWDGDRFIDSCGSPLQGPQRLRLHVGLLPSARRFHFRYYLELLHRAPT